MNRTRGSRVPIWLRLLLLALFGIVVAIMLAIVWLLSGSRLERNGELTVSGIGQVVEIHFDERAVPHVAAEVLDDAFFAQGFLHARQRLWQMDLLRRAGNARLSELLGEGMVKTDEALWRAGVPELRDRLAANASGRYRELVDAYAAGVNAGIETLRQPPPEYLLARAEPAPWQPEDAFALGALMAFDSSGNHDREILRHALANRLDASHMAVFMTRTEPDPDFPYLWAPGDDENTLSEQPLAFARAVAPEARPHGAAIRFGSNGWTVAPARSAGGHALFAFDSHDTVGLPNLFYEIHLFHGQRQLRGWSVPGLPGFINGFNESMAWGFTNIGDSQDLVLLEADPDDPLRFFDGEGWHEGNLEQTDIPVHRSDPVRSERIVTRYGPLISDDPPLALRWTGQEIGSAGMDALLDMNLARDLDEFDQAMRRFPAPVANITWADTSGNVGFRTIGLLPVRRHGEGLKPLADTGQDPWKGIVPVDEMPVVVNPETGFVAAANARVHDEGWPHLVSNDNAPGYRIRRIVEVLEARHDHDLDSMAELQSDVFNVQGRRDLPRLLALLEETPDQRRDMAVVLLQAWLESPFNHADSAPALIFESWYLALVERLFSPVLGEDVYRQLLRHNYVVNHAMERLLDDPGHVWWRGDAGRLAAESLDAALGALFGELGDDMTAWRLDLRHRLIFRHDLSSAVPWLGRWFDRGPYRVGGGHATVGRAGYRYDQPFNASHAASVRVVLEMDETIRGRAVIPGGQSGHLLSPHYDDQIDAWVNGEHFDLYPVPEAVTGARLRLVPSGTD